MQVLLFMGENHYLRKRFEDFVGVWAAVPSAEQIAAAVRAKMEGDNIYDLQTMQVDWVDVLELDGTETPAQYYWEVGHNIVHSQLTAQGYAQCWQDAQGGWHGVRELVRKVSHYADLNFIDYAVKAE